EQQRDDGDAAGEEDRVEEQPREGNAGPDVLVVFERPGAGQELRREDRDLALGLERGEQHPDKREEDHQRGKAKRDESDHRADAAEWRSRFVPRRHRVGHQSSPRVMRSWITVRMKTTTKRKMPMLAA